MSTQLKAMKLLSALPSPRRVRRRIKVSWEQRLIEESGLFDREFYLSSYRDVGQSDLDPLLHYVLHGHVEGRNPSGGFNTKQYRRRHQLAENQNPLVHYIERRRRSTVARAPSRAHDVAVWQLEPDDVPVATRPPAGEIGVFIHLFYDDLAKEILGLLNNIPYPYRVYISTDTTAKQRNIEAVLAELSLADRTVIKILPNRGWDIGPFLVGFANEITQHEICLKLQGKKSNSASEEYGIEWRRHIFSELVGHPVVVARIASLFMSHAELGVVMPNHWEGVFKWLNVGDNVDAMQAVLRRLKLDVPLNRDQKVEFASGSMYWFRSRALAPLLGLQLGWDDFSPPDEGVRDATFAHGIERSLLFCVAKGGFRWSFSPARQLLSDLTDEVCQQIIELSGEFDRSYYLEKYRDVTRNKWDPVEHYVKLGWRDHRNPSPDFNGRYYKELIENAGYVDVNPLLHYIMSGKARGLSPQRAHMMRATIVVDDLYGAYRSAESATTYVRETVPSILESTVKPIAFYLPQFHPFEENNRFWGRGFTEWTNTTKAQPMFEGHYQPRLPGELGFYDTRVREVLARQMELARQYGIHGFCLHHYFLEGRPVMRVPYDHILADRSLDLPFCLHWANEPWTVEWDGEARLHGTLLKQIHSPEDDLAFFKDIEPAITDPRYITVNGRPLLLIYRPGLFPDIKATIERWRGRCRAIGLPPLFLAAMQTIFDGDVDPREFGFDAAVEFPPHNLPVPNVSESVRLYDPGFEGLILDYRAAMEKALARDEPPYTRFQGIVPDWDCTPRRSNPGLFINSHPSLYGEWLEEICVRTRERLPVDRQFVFINAWNEWAEGAYLEPDRKYGYAYLQATADAVNRAAAAPLRRGAKRSVGRDRPRATLSARIRE